MKNYLEVKMKKVWKYIQIKFYEFIEKMKKSSINTKDRDDFIITLIISIFLGLFIWDLAIISTGKTVCYHVSFWSLFFNLLLIFVFFIIVLIGLLSFNFLVEAVPIIAIVFLLLPFAFVYAFFKENYEIFSSCSIIKVVKNTYVFLIGSILVSYFIVLKVLKDTKKDDF